MKKLRNSLDKKSKTNNLFFPRKLNKNNITYLINNINLDYHNLNNDPIINNIINNLNKPRLLINKEKILINKEINNLDDLLELINDYPIINNVTYNLDLNKLNLIKNELQELNNMIGLENIKINILDQILFYLQNFHENTGINYMHTIINGPPGTGKTEIAKIIGKIFSKLSILKKGTFQKVVRSDLIAEYLGQTAIKTRKVIEESLDGVLFIDEAYSLGNSEKRDSFAKECIDTLCECLSNYKDRLMVIIAGYEKELDNCFFIFNPGLKSRFPWCLKTDYSSPEQLRSIFLKKIKEINWSIKENNLNLDIFENNKDLFKYYGRDIEILLNKTTICHSKRVLCLDQSEKTILIDKDLENGIELFKKNKKDIAENNDDVILRMYN